jgi:peptidoglycan hydrolase-like protein with peptidoglycan-binding domain
MASRHIRALAAVLAAVAAAAALAWVAGSRIESPADAAARTAPPVPSPILVPVEKRVLGSSIVARGTARFGVPEPVSIAPSTLKPAAGLIATLPLRGVQVPEGGVLLTASGRPVFVLSGKLPAYRDLVPGIKGDDVRQLEEALARLGYHPGAVDGHYDQQTAAAVARWYRAKGWEPFGPTKDQLTAVRTLEREAGDASKAAQSAAAAAAAAAPSVEAARAAAEHSTRTAAAEVAARIAEVRALEAGRDTDLSLALRNERAKADHANAAAESELAAQIADEAFISLDPRQPETARMAAKAKLELARTAAHKTRLEGLSAVQAAERAAAQVGGKIEVAKSAVASAQLAERAVRLEGEKLVRAALDAQKLAELDARLAGERARQLAADLDLAQQKLGVQVPVDELVFVRTLPVRVEEIKAAVGAAATGPVLSVTDNQLSIDSSLTLDAAPLVKAGMKVAIDEQALGVNATGTVQTIASTPGTRGVDGFHIYFEVRVDPTPAKLDGFSVRLTIPIKSTDGAVTAVPMSALSLAADGSSRVQVQEKGELKYVVVKPGLSADGFVEVTPTTGRLELGQLVVVGYNEPKSQEAKK